METNCKRMKVTAVGKDKEGKFAEAVNFNQTKCLGEVGNCGCIHAEIRLLEVMPNPITVWLSHSPCLTCAIALHRAEVSKVVYTIPYRKTDGVEYLKKNGVEVISRG